MTQKRISLLNFFQMTRLVELQAAISVGFWPHLFLRGSDTDVFRFKACDVHHSFILSQPTKIW